MKFFSKKKTQSPPHHSGFDVSSRITKDWVMVLGVFVVLVLFAAIADGYLLFKINRGDFFHSETSSSVSAETVKRKKLVDVVEYFDARSADYARLWSTTTPRVDPSL
jgi:hypothetical protein